MKMISLSFDVHRKEYEDVGIFEMFGYCFNPATYFFGLFTSFQKYKNAKGFTNPKNEIRPLLFALGYLIASCASVFYGDCLLSLLPDRNIRLNEFRDAQSFRFGHYFVQYFLWSTAILGGFNGNLKTVDALKIEIPRSMEEIVSYWNIPMHEFLHRYVYSNTRSISHPFAIGITFLTSALMHGINFQIAAVLISLGIFGIAETAFRRRLAHRLNLCVQSRACVHCVHRTGRSLSSTVITRCINIIFTISNIILLIYLGMPFDNDETAQIGYSMQHTLGHWKRWYFGGHIYSLLLLLASFAF
uniref:Protein-serine O-palmitoleoyltransferase porcupine n=1 Tax=Panagrolaimus superbus TaxID=310955 RepID=A0A914Z9D3_9BILA